MALRALGALLLVCAAALTGAVDSEGNPVVTIRQGALRGYSIERNDHTVYAFEGIPYARPPIGDRRFKDPEETEPWTEEFNATATGPNCVQKNIQNSEMAGEEDCLFINVYTTASPGTWINTKQPVIVWIHGGAFIVGSGNMDRTRPDNFLKQGFVFVSFNYRLDILGFLNTEDNAAPGNAGLKDMVLALRWVKENIAAFGGDSEQVSIMGLSAGGAAVHYLTISPLASGLFNRAVALSGSALNPWALMKRPRELAEKRRSRLQCDADLDLVSCLRSVDARTLVASKESFSGPGKVELQFWKNAFVPSVEAPGSTETPFLPARPEVLTKTTSANPVPFMTGIVDTEGILLLKFGDLITNDSSRWALLNNDLDNFREDLPEGLDTTENIRRIWNFYLGNRKMENAPTDPETMTKFLQMCTDLYFAEGSIRAADGSKGRGAPTYFYEFTYDSPASSVIKNVFYNATHIPGVAHGGDAAFLFDMNFPLSEEEKNVRDKYVSLIANFMKTGNPTPEGSSWPQYTSEVGSYADIGKEVTYKDHALGDRLALWREVEATLNGSMSSTQDSMTSTSTSAQPST